MNAKQVISTNADWKDYIGSLTSLTVDPSESRITGTYIASYSVVTSSITATWVRKALIEI